MVLGEFHPILNVHRVLPTHRILNLYNDCLSHVIFVIYLFIHLFQMFYFSFLFLLKMDTLIEWGLGYKCLNL